MNFAISEAPAGWPGGRDLFQQCRANQECESERLLPAQHRKLRQSCCPEFPCPLRRRWLAKSPRSLSAFLRVTHSDLQFSRLAGLVRPRAHFFHVASNTPPVDWEKRHYTCSLFLPAFWPRPCRYFLFTRLFQCCPGRNSQEIQDETLFTPYLGFSGDFVLHLFLLFICTCSILRT